MNKKIKRSPLFYVGDKYKLMAQLLDLFPRRIGNFYEPFVGGGTVFLNVEAKRYLLNDIDAHLVNIHKFLVSVSNSPGKFFDAVEEIIDGYNLSRSYKKDIVPGTLKQQFKKTYYARFNKDGYERLKLHANKDPQNNPLILYILLIYGFNRMLRFNRNGSFNLPVGNVDFNKNVVRALYDYFEFVSNNEIMLISQDFKAFFKEMKYEEDDFVYFDPPYLITASEYNKLWNEKAESDLLKFIDNLNRHKVKFALSNVTHYNGSRNDLLVGWMKKYNVHNIKSNYINYHNNTHKEIKEVLITNY